MRGGGGLWGGFGRMYEGMRTRDRRLRNNNETSMKRSHPKADRFDPTHRQTTEIKTTTGF